MAAFGPRAPLHVIPLSLSLALSLWRSKVLYCWLASLPVQLSQLGHRNPALSARLIQSIQAAASRGNKDLLNSLQTHACRLYGRHAQLERQTKRSQRLGQLVTETSFLWHHIWFINIRYNYQIDYQIDITVVTNSRRAENCYGTDLCGLNFVPLDPPQSAVAHQILFNQLAKSWCGSTD